MERFSNKVITSKLFCYFKEGNYPLYQFLKKQPVDLRVDEHDIQQKLQSFYNGDSLNFKDIARIRLETAYLTLEAVQESILHNGSAGYIQDSAPSRRLREAYFFANLTPTVKHLEKVLNG
ncbi:hypothetical protein J2Y03_003494 [Neobacillus niacini]|nr:hypothetical protein [Neobacillus niacini]